MHLHEYQTKQILLSYGIKTDPFAIATTIAEVEKAVELLQLENGGVVKAQIHAGARGKGGGVYIAKDKEEIIAAANKLLGSVLVTPQTGKEGLPVHKVLLSPKIEIKREYYIGITIDRKRALPLLIVSKEGGSSIEEVAQKTPEAIFTMPLSIDGRIHSYQLTQVVKFLGWKEKLWRQGRNLIANFVRAFHETDSLLFEINPLVEDKEGNLLAIDAKFLMDDNAIYRREDIASHFDKTQLKVSEYEASRWGLTYVALDGDIGCLVNGAGLSMAVMDLIHLLHGKPANFLDIGGVATEEAIIKGLEMILIDPKIKVIFINILGELVSCVMLARALLKAANQVSMDRTVVIRFFGTDIDEGKKVLEKASFRYIVVKNLEEGARVAIEEVRKYGHTH